MCRADDLEIPTPTLPARRLVWRALLAVALAMLPLGLSAQVVSPTFSGDYLVTDLGSVPGLPPSYGGLTFKLGDANKILIGGNGNTAAGLLYEIGVVRDANDHIVGFSGTATAFAQAAYNDGGVTYGPGNVLFTTGFPVNQIRQLEPGSFATDKVIDLAPLGIASSVGTLQFVPGGFPGAGSLKVLSWPGGQWYEVAYAPDGNGTFDLLSASQRAVLGGGPEGLIYVPLGSPQFANPSVLVCEWSAGNVAAFEVDSFGDAIPATRRSFVTGLSGAEGAVLDPLTNDFLFSTFGGGNRVIVVRGFEPPPPSDPDADDDGVLDADDNCPADANPGQQDLDTDDVGDACDPDADGDGDPVVTDCNDLNPSVFAGATEICSDGVDNNCNGQVDEQAAGSDCDADGVPNELDNCPLDFNDLQEDLDGDDLGDVCDADIDGDGVANGSDNCPVHSNSGQQDFDGDGAGNPCDADADADGLADATEDQCLFTTTDPAAGVPSKSLGKNRWAEMDGNLQFDTNGGNPTGRLFTFYTTGGCSCAQIIAACGYGEGHTKFGCSNSVMDWWTGLYDRAGEAPFQCKAE